MNNITRHTGRLHVITRLDSSKNGNPRYLLSIDGITCRTPVDSSLGYAVPNMDCKMVEATIGTHYGLAHLNTVKVIREA